MTRRERNVAVHRVRVETHDASRRHRRDGTSGWIFGVPPPAHPTAKREAVCRRNYVGISSYYRERLVRRASILSDRARLRLISSMDALSSAWVTLIASGSGKSICSRPM